MISFDSKIVDCVVVTSYSSDFNGSVTDWQNSYFDLLSWHNTWNLDYSMSICGRGDNPYIKIVIPDRSSTLDCLLGFLNDLNYGNVKTYPVKACIIEPSGDIDIDIDEWFIG